MRTWLITGCSTGIGRAIAAHVLAIGEAAAVTARNPADVADIVAAAPDRAIALALDVTDPAQVAAAVAATEQRFGAIDVLVSNAGYGYVSSIEEGDEAAVKAMYEVNLFGALRMMKAVLPGMRARRSGTILSIGSLAGRIANPATGYYSSSKFALEALSDTIRLELRGTNIYVSLIEPGPIRTRFVDNALANLLANIDIENSLHRDVYRARIEGMKAGGKSFFKLEPSAVSKRLIHALESPRPRRQYYVTAPTYIAAILKRTMPLAVSEYVAKKF